MRPPGHHRHHHHHRRHRFRGPPPAGWRRRWALARGIHRRLISSLVLAMTLGGGAGWLLHHGVTIGLGIGGAVLLAGFVLALVPLAWVATFRIAGPLAHLADVAGALRDGELARREELSHGPDEVGQVAGALQDMADRVTEQLEDQRSLMAAVSHELRSPLARVRVLVELAREGRAPDGLHDDLQAEIDGMDALVGDLLAAARIDFEAARPRELDASDVARRALELAGLPEGLLQAPAVPRIVRADPTLLARALRGLLDNGTRHGGRVLALRVEASDAHVRFVVEDDGPGFAAGETEQVFEPFWRRPPTAGVEAPAGTGLGLALVRRIARSHGGDAGAANREGGGAAVWVDLP